MERLAERFELDLETIALPAHFIPYGGCVSSGSVGLSTKVVHTWEFAHLGESYLNKVKCLANTSEVELYRFGDLYEDTLLSYNLYNYQIQPWSP